jgi:polyhydroxyalkanoate synthase
VPVLVFGGATDGIAPVPAVRAVVPMLTKSPEVRFEVVPGGHLGMLTGRAARTTTWLAMDEWITQWSTDNRPATPIGTNRTRRHSSAASRALGK